MIESPPSPVSSLYVHVPFCAQKCNYCAFYSEASSGELISRYVQSLLRELEMIADGSRLQTIFFGGGTPSLLNLRQWEQILKTMERLGLAKAANATLVNGITDVASSPSPREERTGRGLGRGASQIRESNHLNSASLELSRPLTPALSPDGGEGEDGVCAWVSPFEWTVECNPATVSLDKAKLLRDHGVNRISMGVQSLDEALLDKLGRIHSREMVFKSFDILRAAGFDNINIDLMFAIPGQTLDVWRETLTEATALGSEHLSSYEVIYEDDTPLFARLKAGEFDVDEELAEAMFEELVSHATRSGFHQYEIANFARNFPKGRASGPGEIGASEIPSQACKHNVNYWRGGAFHGLGPSATGYVGGVRYKNVSNTQAYCDRLEKGERGFESKEELSPRARAGEIAAFGLRMNAGWPFEQFERVTGWDLRGEWSGEMNQLVARGWARADERHFQLTPKGLRFADSAAELFLR